MEQYNASLNPLRFRGHTTDVRQFAQHDAVLAALLRRRQRPFAAAPSAVARLRLVRIADAAQLAEHAHIAAEQRCHQHRADDDGNDEQRTDLLALLRG